MTSQAVKEQLWGLPPSRPAAISVAVVTDDDTIAQRVIDALERDGMLPTLEAAGGDVSALDDLDVRPDVVVLRRHSEQAGLEGALRSVRGRVASASLVVVLPAPARADVGRLLAAGADGAIVERDLDAALAPVVRAVAARLVCVPAELRHLLHAPALSHRERQILGLAVAGLSNAEIGERLFLSESTVKTHLSAAFRRLGVHSRREAAALVLGSDDSLRRTVLATLRLSEVAPRRWGER